MFNWKFACIGVVLIAAACGDRSSPEQQGQAFSGPTLTSAKPKPQFVLTSDEGKPYDFRGETDGKLTYLFFGYTYCPDVCPLHMANLGAVYRKLPFTEQQKIRVVFVTTDPGRDTPARLKTWLDNFHPDFVGLSGDMEQINTLQQSMGMPPAAIERTDSSSALQYGVAHGAAVLTFTPDDSLRVLYPFGTRQQDFAKDIPQLLKVGARR